MNEIVHALKDWIPFRLKAEGNKAVCQWIYLGSHYFDEPFFEETIAKCKQLKENSQLFRVITDVNMLAGWAPHLLSLPPTAVIFHVSRCGSTLLSQLLAQNSSNITLSEVPLFDDLLRWGFRNNNIQNILPLVKDAVSFHGVKRNEQQQHLFIKADSWHVHFYKEYRELYPGIPFIFLYRRPDEVIRSHQKLRGMQAVQGVIEPALFGFDDSVFHIPLDEYMSKVLETYYSCFIQILQKDKLAFAFDYKDGMINIVEKMMDICGIGVSDELMTMMKERNSKHGKFPGQTFSEPKIAAAPPAYQAKAFELYDLLDSLKK